MYKIYNTRTVKPQSGFTLIEIMVVLVIIGIILSVAVIGGGNRQADQLNEDVRRLLQIIKLAQEEAIINHREMAIKFGNHHYELQLFDTENKSWLEISDPTMFRRRELDTDYEIRLLQDGISVSLDGEDEGRVMLFSSGEMTPFELEISLPDTEVKYRMLGTMVGELNVEDMHAYGSVIENEDL